MHICRPRCRSSRRNAANLEWSGRNKENTNDIVFSMKCKWWLFMFRSMRTYYKFCPIWCYSEGSYSSLLGVRTARGDFTETEYTKSMVIPSKAEPWDRRIIFSCRKQHSPNLAVPRIVINSFFCLPCGVASMMTLYVTSSVVCRTVDNRLNKFKVEFVLLILLGRIFLTPFRGWSLITYIIVPACHMHTTSWCRVSFLRRLSLTFNEYRPSNVASLELNLYSGTNIRHGN
jgi:hypothetical protein